MCHFIFALLPACADTTTLKEIFTQHRRKLTLRSNPDPRIASWLLDGERCYWTTRGQCDCGSSLIAYGDARGVEQTYEKEIRKLSRQGWSKHKVENWIAQKVSARERLDLKVETAAADELENWHKLLSGILQNKLTPYIGLLIFADDKDTTLSGRIPHKLGNGMDRLEENKIYEITL